MERRRLAALVENEHPEDKKPDLLTSGCSLLDCVLGGGYAQGRIVNIAGDRSTGKTLLAIEACANFRRKHPEGYIRYAEAESAFDVGYARTLGCPVDSIDFVDDIYTVEDLHDDIAAFTKVDKGDDRPRMYVLDSLDALSDKAELERGIDEGSYGGNKAKKMGELFRRLVKPISQSNCLVVIISQLRDKVGVSFGETQLRSGGRALDFYASQILWLAEKSKIYQEVRGVKLPVGVEIKATCKKNKVGLAFRTCEFPILFNYGIDDLTAAVEWLKNGANIELSTIGLNDRSFKHFLKTLRSKGGPELEEFRKRLNQIVEQQWNSIETEFLPKISKY